MRYGLYKSACYKCCSIHLEGSAANELAINLIKDDRVWFCELDVGC